MDEHNQAQFNEILRLLQNKNATSNSAAPDEFQKIASTILQLRDALSDKDDKDMNRGDILQAAMAFIAIILGIGAGWVNFTNQITKIDYRLLQTEKTVEEIVTEFKKVQTELLYNRRVKNAEAEEAAKNKRFE